MTHTRTGKIAKLPQDIREQLNRRLQNGESGKTLIAWLNALPAVIAVLAADFAGQPINPQNFSDWVKGGYQDWRMLADAKELIPLLAAEARELQATTTEPLSDVLALWMTAQCMVTAKHLAPTDDWKKLREICGYAVELRKGDHSAAKLKIDEAQLEHLHKLCSLQVGS